MKVVIDVRCLSEGRRTGVEEYVINLLFNIFEIDKNNEYILFFNSWKKSKFDFSWIDKYPNVTLKTFKFPNKILNFFFWYFDWPKIDKLVGGADIVFMPNIIFGSVSNDAKIFLTVHDLSFEEHSEYFSLKRKLWHFFINAKKVCQKAEKIIAVSQSTADDLVRIYKIDRKKINLIYSGCFENLDVIDRNSSRLIEIKKKYSLPYKFILYFGTVEPRKNIVGLVRAYNLFQKKAIDNNEKNLSDFNLIIAGERGWLNEKIFSEINNSPYNNKIKVINSVKDEDRKYLYNLASLLVYPSFFEGFGFPPIEAMKCGVPVVCSNNSSLPEVVGDAAVLIDSDRSEEIYQAMREVLRKTEFRSFLVEKGLKKSSFFKWEKTARKVIDLFENK
jgi:glycosyltransferase involved in cell wall biosynthesis